jgi:hypothetical protein
MSPDTTVAGEFLQFSRWKLIEEYWPRLRGCVESLSDDDVWWRPNEASNSVGNILLHLNGNVRQWLVVPFTGGADRRDRPAEFRERATLPRSALLQPLSTTIADAEQVLRSLTARELLMPLAIQGYNVTGLEAVYQVIEHFGMHYGQVVYITKQLHGRDLGFYRELDATGRRGG